MLSRVRQKFFAITLCGWLYLLLFWPLSGTVHGQLFTILKGLSYSDGYSPYATPVLAGNVLYGTSYSGGTAAKGTVYKINTDGSGYTILKSFDAAGPNTPISKLLLSGNTLYGTTLIDGTDASTKGSVFKINTDGTGYTVLKHFASTNGAGPRGGLVLSGTTLYGTTYYGGSWDLGTVFKINTDGSGFRVLREFTPYDGACPAGDLALAGGVLYGTTYNSGGTNGMGGLVFKIKTDGSGFAVLKSFAYADGNHPYAGLTLAADTLYGAAYSAGQYGCGTIFKLRTNGTAFSVLCAFASTNGTSPYSTPTLSGTTLYGTTYDGGSPLATTAGTIFQVNTDGTGFTVLRGFSGADGTRPYAGVVVSGDKLYGVTSGGGPTFFGTIFSFAPNGVALPNITSQPQSRTNTTGTAATFQVTATPETGLSYQWRKNSLNLANSGLVSGATTNMLTLASVQLADAGNYSVVVSNSAGALTSSVAVLTVKGPPVANADSFQVPLGLTLSIPVGSLLANDRDPNGEALGVASVQSTSTAGASLSYANGLVTYWGAFSGSSDHFTYTVTNCSGLGAVGTVMVALTGTLPNANQLCTVPLSDGSLRVIFLGHSTIRYALERTHNLTPPQTWEPLQTNWAGAMGYLFFTNTPSPGTCNYYRVRMVLGPL